MIRSLGSSLLAKAGTGSLSRKKDETRITKPEIPGKAATGTAVRDLTQETEIQPVAPGSEKIIRSAPGIESASLPGMAAKQVPLVAGIGSPGGAAPAPAAGQPMLRSEGGGGASASQPGQAGRQATVAQTAGAPMGAIATKRAADTAAAEAAKKAVLGAQTNVQAPSAERASLGEKIPVLDLLFGGTRSYADEGQKNPTIWYPTAAQQVVGTLGNVVNKVGQALGNPIKDWGLTEKAQNFGGSQSVAASGIGSIGNALRSVVNQVKNTFSNLRSKWGW